MTKEELIEWLEIEVSAVDTRYRGSPSYERSAYWFKDEVLELLNKAKKYCEENKLQNNQK